MKIFILKQQTFIFPSCYRPRYSITDACASRSFMKLQSSCWPRSWSYQKESLVGGSTSKLTRVFVGKVQSTKVGTFSSIIVSKNFFCSFGCLSRISITVWYYPIATKLKHCSILNSPFCFSNWIISTYQFYWFSSVVLKLFLTPSDIYIFDTALFLLYLLFLPGSFLFSLYFFAF